MSLDIFAIALIALMSSIALLMRLRATTRVRSPELEAFYRPDRSDPVRMTLPLTGLRDPARLPFEDAYWPAEAAALLEGSRAEAMKAAGSGDQVPALHAASPTRGRARSAPVQDALVGMTLLLGLAFLLFWLITIF